MAHIRLYNNRLRQIITNSLCILNLLVLGGYTSRDEEGPSGVVLSPCGA